MMIYEIVVKSEKGVQIRFEINADTPGTALEVAAAREREMRKIDRFIKGPT